MTFLNILLILHIIGLIMGFVGGRSHAEILKKIDGASEETASVLWEFEKKASWTAFLGTTILIISGSLLVTLKYGGISLQSSLFWLKMNLVVVVAVAEIIRHLTALRWKNGDKNMAKWSKISGKISGLSALLIIVIAVFNFN